MAIRTLNEIAHLKNSACGKPYPRHGLQLLYWFACDCVNFEDGQPFLEYDPSDGDFGFKEFYNNEDLLPDQDNPYYEVGNLNSDAASELPEYVRENNDNEPDKTITNADRIIICLDDDNGYLCLDRLYVTRHHGQWNFDQNHTFRISKGLLKIISNFSDHYEFLRAVGYMKKQRPTDNHVTRDLHITIPKERPSTVMGPSHVRTQTTAIGLYVTMSDERPSKNSVPVMGQRDMRVQTPAEGLYVTIPEERPSKNTTATRQSNVRVQTPAESVYVTMPKEGPQSATKRPRPRQGWNICKCTIL